jgi:hypothetical protein
MWKYLFLNVNNFEIKKMSPLKAPTAPTALNERQQRQQRQQSANSANRAPTAPTAPTERQQLKEVPFDIYVRGNCAIPAIVQLPRELCNSLGNCAIP